MINDDTKRAKYWLKLRLITLILLMGWFFVTFVLSYFAIDLQFTFFGWPFSFWVGAQGSLLVYLIIVWIYAHYVNRLDDEFLKDKDNET